MKIEKIEVQIWLEELIAGYAKSTDFGFTAKLFEGEEVIKELHYDELFTFFQFPKHIVLKEIWNQYKSRKFTTETFQDDSANQESHYSDLITVDLTPLFIDHATKQRIIYQETEL